MPRRSTPALQDPFVIGDPSYDALARSLSKFERRQVVSMVGGLLTVPRYQAQGLRLEMMVRNGWSRGTRLSRFT
jgi:hypothetical protein